MNKLYGFKTAPARCGMSESLFRDLCRSGRGPRNPVRIDDSGVAWTEQALVEWLRERRVPAGHPRPSDAPPSPARTSPGGLTAMAPFLRFGKDRSRVAKAADTRSATFSNPPEPMVRTTGKASKPSSKKPLRGASKDGSPSVRASEPAFRAFCARGLADRANATPAPAGALWQAAMAKAGITPGRTIGQPLRPTQPGLVAATKTHAAIADTWAEAAAKAGVTSYGRRKR